MPNNIETLSSNEITLILEDHAKFLVLMGDVASCCIPDSGWSRVRSLISPTNHFDVSDPMMMVPKLLINTKIKLDKFMIFEKRKVIKLYLNYIFPDYEGAACNEFLLKSSLDIKQEMSVPGVIHQMRKSQDENKVYAVITVSTRTADNIYMALIDTLNTLK